MPARPKLTNRTKLTPDQLATVKGRAPEGLASRYDETGRQSIELTRRLVKAKRKAKKFILFSDQLGKRLYVGMCEGELTFDKKEAMKFYYGFDDPTVKARWWSWEISKRGLVINFQTKQL